MAVNKGNVKVGLVPAEQHAKHGGVAGGERAVEQALAQGRGGLVVDLRQIAQHRQRALTVAHLAVALGHRHEHARRDLEPALLREVLQRKWIYSAC